MIAGDALLIGLDPSVALTSVALGESVDLYLAMIRRASETPVE